MADGRSDRHSGLPERLAGAAAGGDGSRIYGFGDLFLWGECDRAGGAAVAIGRGGCGGGRRQ